MYRRTSNAVSRIPTGFASVLGVLALFALSACSAPVKPTADQQAAGPLKHASFRVLVGTERGDLVLVLDPATANQVAVTVCWQGPKDARPRFHRVIGYIN